jgi:uncharacterized protein YjbJ (UPF0337 family)
MNEDRMTGTAKNLGGKVQEGFGKVTGDKKTEADGLLNQAEGAVQDLYGQAKEGVETAVGAAKDSAVTLE